MERDFTLFTDYQVWHSMVVNTLYLATQLLKCVSSFPPFSLSLSLSLPPSLFLQTMDLLTQFRSRLDRAREEKRKRARDEEEEEEREKELGPVPPPNEEEDEEKETTSKDKNW